MRCELRAEVPVQRFAVTAEMAWLERRPELSVLCRSAREAGRRIDEEAVQRALPGVSGAAARNVVDWCRMLRLCDGRGMLTPVGEHVADSDLAPVPEQGVFDLWVTDHPLLGRRILHAARLRSEKDGRLESLMPLPVDPEIDKPFASLVSSDQFMLRAVLPQGRPECLPRPDRSECRVRWSIDFGAGSEAFQLDGTLDVGGESRPIRHSPERTGIELLHLRNGWASAHLGRHGHFQTEMGRLQVPFENLPEPAQESFVRPYRIDVLEVPGKGEYREVMLEDVPIGALSPQDAQRWARARFERRLTREPRYRTRDELRRLFASVVDGTPLQQHRPMLPEHATLVRETHAHPAVFWSLCAPVDLSPFEANGGRA